MSGPQISPKLVVRGADEAIAFYEAVLGARPRSRYAAGGAVVFASLDLPRGAQLQVKEADDTDPAPPEGGGGVVLDILTDDPDAVMQRALDHGASEVFPVADQAYGARQGRFRDPFGHQWIVGTPVAMSDEEVQAALDAWSRHT
ncbi:glyoxalase/bleomycin resistance/extradiol dioxygenase family protein [uncultured Serinicoccus sp.]|uniref:VOC family protein n=1 Tax=uncultured Serinicoccus sp. TaxID=735514 RepID=UPI002636F53E|nr:VOC family protein [uncultured Serinicoccus sp.]